MRPRFRRRFSPRGTRWSPAAGSQAGERVLIHAVGSGVGTAAVQLARRLGATSVGTSRSPAKLDRARALGLDEAIDTSGGGFRDAALARRPRHPRCAGRSRRSPTTRGPRPARPAGAARLPAGAEAEVNLEPILRKRLEVIGRVMRTRALEERIPLVAGFSREVLPLVSAVAAQLPPPRRRRDLSHDRHRRGARGDGAGRELREDCAVLVEVVG